MTGKRILSDKAKVAKKREPQDETEASFTGLFLSSSAPKLNEKARQIAANILKEMSKAVVERKPRIFLNSEEILSSKREEHELLIAELPNLVIGFVPTSQEETRAQISSSGAVRHTPTFPPTVLTA